MDSEPGYLRIATEEAFAPPELITLWRSMLDERDRAIAMATLANDQLAEACQRYPDRFSGLTAIAPQDPKGAAGEIERGALRLGFRGVIINSHTQGEYLDDPKFWPIFEAAEVLDTPIYLHPNTPPRNMIGPMLEAGLLAKPCWLSPAG